MRILFLLLSFTLLQLQSSYGHDKSLEKLLVKYKVPSVTGLRIVNDKIDYNGFSGFRKIGTTERITNNDRHHLGSCTKSMTATLAAVLIEMKILNWKTKLSELLPIFNIHKDYKNLPFELLFVHRAGLPGNLEGFTKQWLDQNLYINRPLPNLRSNITKELLGKKSFYTPVRDFKYSNMAYIIAAHILELKMKDSWENLISKYIFKPLGMSSCGFGPVSDPNQSLPKNIWGHKLVNGELTALHEDNHAVYGPAGTVHCSMEDWAKYIKMHIKGSNNQSDFLKARSFEKLYSTYPNDPNNYTYGGWVVFNREWGKGKVLHHTGSNGLHYANVWIAPNINKAFLSTTNSGYQGLMVTDSVISMLINGM